MLFFPAVEAVFGVIQVAPSEACSLTVILSKTLFLKRSMPHPEILTFGIECASFNGRIQDLREDLFNLCQTYLGKEDTFSMPLFHLDW